MDKTIFIIFLKIILIGKTVSQNLIKNESFEKHTSINCLYCHHVFEVFSATMPSWNNLNTNCAIICDVNYKKNSEEQSYVDCQFDKVMPHSGNTMMQLSYHPNCVDFDQATRGCAAYVASKLEKPLEIGKIYELSFWINILKPDDLEYVNHIGAMFYPLMPINKSGAMFEETPFTLDTIIYNQWYQVKWRIKPLCNLKCMAIGVFRHKNGPPVHGKDNKNLYYIDDIFLKEVVELQKKEEKSVINFCRSELPDKNALLEEIEGCNIYFDLGDSVLTSHFLLSLDSFVDRLNQQPTTSFSISGHTDNTGNQNLLLSNARIESVLNYLEKKHHINRCRFLKYNFGDELPVASNATESGRKQNRRVEVKQVNYDLSDVVYRNMLLEIFKQHKVKAFEYLNIWLLVAKDNQKLLMLNDPRIDVLKSDRRWSDIKGKVRNSYKVFKKPQLACTLDSLWAEDQRGRTLEKYIENLQAYLPSIDSTDKRWDVFFPFDTGKVYETNTQFRLEKVISIIDKNGWPKSSEVGKRASKAVVLILTHTDDTLTIARMLPKLESSCKDGESEWIYFVTLYDRYEVDRGKPQKYGTQNKIDPLDENHIELFPLVNPEMVNTWRSQLGLEPISGFK
jgi:outer membrane protein OmpA-like peptidoglycan-associated protein